MMANDCSSKTVDKIDSELDHKRQVRIRSSVDSSVPSILLPQVRVTSTPSTLLSLRVKFVLYQLVFAF